MRSRYSCLRALRCAAAQRATCSSLTPEPSIFEAASPRPMTAASYFKRTSCVGTEIRRSFRPHSARYVDGAPLSATAGYWAGASSARSLRTMPAAGSPWHFAAGEHVELQQVAHHLLHQQLRCRIPWVKHIQGDQIDERRVDLSKCIWPSRVSLALTAPSTSSCRVRRLLLRLVAVPHLRGDLAINTGALRQACVHRRRSDGTSCRRPSAEGPECSRTFAPASIRTTTHGRNTGVLLKTWWAQ